MDSFDIDSLNETIGGFKSSLKSKYQKLTLNTKEIKNNVESLCLIYDYSPKISDEKKLVELFTIKKELFTHIPKDIPEKQNDKEIKPEVVDNSKVKIQNNEINKIKIDYKEHKEKENFQNTNTGSSQSKKSSKIYYPNLFQNPNKSEKISNTDKNKSQQTKPDFEVSENLNKNLSKDKTQENIPFDTKIKESQNKDEKDEQNANSLDSPSSNTSKDKDHEVKFKKHRLTENAMIRVYLLKTQIFIDIQIFFGEQIKNLKIKVLEIIFGTNKNLDYETSNNLNNFNVSRNSNINKIVQNNNPNQNQNPFHSIVSKLKYKDNPDAYEIRLADEDDDVNPNQDFPAFEDTYNLIKSKMNTVCFVENEKYNPNDKKSLLKLGLIDDKVVLKVYIQDGDKQEYTSIVEEHKDKTLLDIYDRLKSKVNKNNGIKHYDYYYFIEHDSNNKKKDNNKKEVLDEIDKEICIDTELKYLTCFELDVIYFILAFYEKIC